MSYLPLEGDKHDIVAIGERNIFGRFQYWDLAGARWWVLLNRPTEWNYSLFNDASVEIIN